jgi:large subunit ribosomal protein L23
MPKMGEILEKILITEKTTEAREGQNKYTFKVRNGVSQGTVRTEIEKIYKVDVLKVNLMIIPGKKRRLAKTSRYIRLPKWKKAVVQLKEGQKIEEAKEKGKKDKE